ncbi:MAG: ribbon-helix-helix domain-containing protein [Treponema sp.]|nr:ribbon-helix-helix domain-containing protein [Treponema sp.]
MYDQITTARLPADIRNKLLVLSRIKGKTKSDIIKESVEMYYANEENEIDSFVLGEPYFGRYGSGDRDRSTSYKKRIKENLRAKLDSY